MRLIDADALLLGKKVYRWGGTADEAIAEPYAIAITDIDAAPTVSCGECANRELDRLYNWQCRECWQFANFERRQP
jgi:hypothetical protein